MHFKDFPNERKSEWNYIFSFYKHKNLKTPSSSYKHTYKAWCMHLLCCIYSIYDITVHFYFFPMSSSGYIAKRENTNVHLWFLRPFLFFLLRYFILQYHCRYRHYVDFVKVLLFDIQKDGSIIVEYLGT